jgi:hypothetical protein
VRNTDLSGLSLQRIYLHGGPRSADTDGLSPPTPCRGAASSGVHSPACVTSTVPLPVPAASSKQGRVRPRLLPDCCPCWLAAVLPLAGPVPVDLLHCRIACTSTSLRIRKNYIRLWATTGADNLPLPQSNPNHVCFIRQSKTSGGLVVCPERPNNSVLPCNCLITGFVLRLDAHACLKLFLTPYRLTK